MPTLPLRLPTFFSVKVGAGGNAWLNAEGMLSLFFLSWGWVVVCMNVNEGQGECRSRETGRVSAQWICLCICRKLYPSKVCLQAMEEYSARLTFVSDHFLTLFFLDGFLTSDHFPRVVPWSFPTLCFDCFLTTLSRTIF